MVVQSLKKEDKTDVKVVRDSFFYCQAALCHLINLSIEEAIDGIS